MKVTLNKFLNFKEKSTFSIDFKSSEREKPTMICGANETGKSKLLEMIYDVISMNIEEIKVNKIYENADIIIELENDKLLLRNQQIGMSLSEESVIDSSDLKRRLKEKFNEFWEANVINYLRDKLSPWGNDYNELEPVIERKLLTDLTIDSSFDAFFITNNKARICNKTLNHGFILEKVKDVIELCIKQLSGSSANDSSIIIVDKKLINDINDLKNFSQEFSNNISQTNSSYSSYGYSNRKIDLKSYLSSLEENLLTEEEKKNLFNQYNLKQEIVFLSFDLSDQENNFKKISTYDIRRNSLNSIQKRFLKIAEIKSEDLSTLNELKFDNKEAKKIEIQKKLNKLSTKFIKFYNSINKMNSKESFSNNSIFKLQEEKTEQVVNVYDPRIENSVGYSIKEYKSSGFLEFIQIFIGLYYYETENVSNSKSIIIFDEPGNYLHFNNRFKLIDLFKESKNKIIYSTHNIEMMDVEEIITLFQGKDKKEINIANLTRASDSLAFNLRSNILNLLFNQERDNIVNAVFNLDYFNNKKIVVFEGKIDKMYFEKLFKKEIDEKEIRVLIGNSYSTFTNYNEILTASNFKELFFIFDNDKNIEQDKYIKNLVEKTAQFDNIKVLKLDVLNKCNIEDFMKNLLQTNSDTNKLLEKLKNNNVSKLEESKLKIELVKTFEKNFEKFDSHEIEKNKQKWKTIFEF